MIEKLRKLCSELDTLLTEIVLDCASLLSCSVFVGIHDDTDVQKYLKRIEKRIDFFNRIENELKKSLKRVEKMNRVFQKGFQKKFKRISKEFQTDWKKNWFSKKRNTWTWVEKEFKKRNEFFKRFGSIKRQSSNWVHIPAGLQIKRARIQSEEELPRVTFPSPNFSNVFKSQASKSQASKSQTSKSQTFKSQTLKSQDFKSQTFKSWTFKSWTFKSWLPTVKLSKLNFQT